MGKLSRDKGARWEREVARLFGGIRAAPMQAGHSGSYPDVVSDRFAIECKCGKRGSFDDVAALAQAEAATLATGPDGNAPFCCLTPIAVCKEDHHDPVVTLSLCSLIHLFGPSMCNASRSSIPVRVNLYDFMEELNVQEGS